MLKLFLFVVGAALSLPLAAQQQPSADQKPQAQDQKPQAQEEKPAPKAEESTNEKERIRVDGAAGGTAPVPPEKRKAVGPGAGPHLHDNLPSPQKLPRDEPVQPSK